jgi:hypothetical protein
MQIDVVDIHGTIVNGLKKAWQNHFLMTHELDKDITPEYLTSASVCYAFSDFISKNELHGYIVVRAEAQTESLWMKALILLFMKTKSRAGLKSNSSRNGNVDVSLAIKNSGAPEIPFGVIENKGFLLFTTENDLYANSMREVKKDLDRNIEFAIGEKSHGIEYSCFTFYLRDKKSILKNEGIKFCQSKKIYFENICKYLLSPYPTLKYEVEVKTLACNLFESNEEANEPEENGCSRHTNEGAWHIIYGAISIYREGTTVTHTKSFNQDTPN